MLNNCASSFAPAFLAAGWYITLGYLIRYLGPQYCRFNPTFYSVIFVLGDLASLIVQMVIMLAYSLLLIEFVVRYFWDKPVKPFRIWKTKPAMAVPKGVVAERDVKKAKIMIGAMVFSTLLIFIRSIYRVIELLDGWNGPIISNETLFCVLDGLMVFLATAVFNVIHPLWFLPRKTDDHFYETDKYDGKKSEPASVTERQVQSSQETQV
jgi:hypothetical protein